MVSALAAAGVGLPIVHRGQLAHAPPAERSDFARPHEADPVRLSLSDSPPTVGDYYQRTALSIRTKSLVHVDDDGSLRSESQLKLRFHYDFEAADGTQIRIRAKVNLRFSQSVDNNDDTQTTKLRARFKASVLQEQVVQGTSSLLDQPDLNGDSRSGIAQALEQFLQTSSSVIELFQNAEPLDGDSLITGLVDAFNALTNSLNSLFASPRTNLPADSGAESPGPSPTPTPLLVAPVPEPSTELSNPPSHGDAGPPTTAEEIGPTLIAEPLPTDSRPEPPVDDATITDDQGADAPSADTAPQATSENADDRPATPASIVSSVTVKLRLQVMHSLTQLADTFGSPPTDLSTSLTHLTFRASLKLTARYAVTGPASSGSLLDTRG